MLLNTILVTGGAGFIGSNFILGALKTWPHVKIINVDSLSYASSLKNLEDASEFRHIFSHTSILNTSAIIQLMEKHQPDSVVHFAAESHVDRSIENSMPFVDTNVKGTVSMLNASLRYIRTSQKEHFKFLHISTDEVFGSIEGTESFNESSHYSPNSPYSASKAASDHFTRAYSKTHNLPVVVTNCSNNYGPRQHEEKLIPKIIHSALRGEDIPIYGDGLNIRDWLYVDDHCSALRTILTSSTKNDSYCIGGSHEVTNIQLAKKITSLLDVLRPRRSGSYSEQIKFVSDRPGHDRRYSINSKKLQDELGWKPTVDLDEGLSRTIKWYIDGL